MDAPGDHEPLLDRVDLLLKRHKQPLRSPDDDVPVLTEVLKPEVAAPTADPAMLDALIARLCDAILRHVETSVTQQLLERLEPRIAELVAAEVSTARVELLSRLRESLPAAIATALSANAGDSEDLASR